MNKILAHLQEAGYELPAVIPDGDIHRFKRTPQDKKKDAWYICHQAHTRGGEVFHILIYGDWREGETHKFSTLSKVDADEAAYIKATIEKSRRKQAEEQKRVWEEAAKDAGEEWAAAAQEGSSDYLHHKSIKAYGIRFLDQSLLVPCRDKQSKLWSIQRITPQGKFFYPASRTKGTFHLIGPEPTSDVLLCEGYATGATLHEATGLPVLVAFYASNLPEVARQFENVIVCADNDQFKAENAGVNWANKCGAAKVIIPRFQDLDGEPTDFNDLAIREGLEEVRRQILEDESERQFVLSLGHRDETYYYTSSANRQIVRIPRAGHNKANLMDLMPLEWWEATYPHPKGGANYDLAANALMQKARAQGIFDPNHVRGVGVWKDAGRYVINLGDGLYYDNRRHSLESLHSSYIYEIGPRIPEPVYSQVDLNLLPSLLATVSFKSKQDSLYLLGWLTLAPIAGALDWRPHVWLTGGAGTGKSTMMRFINSLLGKHRHYFQGQTTEAGIRQTTSNGSLPVIFDEFESNDERSSDRIHAVLELMRQASSESEGHVVKGSAGGQAVASSPKFAALVAAIGVSLPNEADNTRFKILELVQGDEPSFKKFLELEARITPQFTSAYFARVFRLLPVLQTNIDIFWSVLRRKYSARIGQQLGTLLAGAWVAKSDVAVTEQEAQVLCDALVMDEQSINRKDELDCIEHLSSSLIRLDGSTTRTVRELMDDDMNVVLERHGMRPDGDRLYIAAKNPALASLFKGTNWAGKWSRSLSRLPESKSGTFRINGKNAHSISVLKKYISDK